MLDSHWSDLGAELLTEVLVLLPFRDRLACEKTCKSWHCTLSCAAQPNVWGYTWTFLNARRGTRQQEIDLNRDHLVMHIPQSSHKYQLLTWALCRVETISHIYLGDPHDPVDLLTDSSAEFVVYELLMQLKEQEDKRLDLSVSIAGCTIATGFRVAAPILELLPSLCTSMTLGPGLTSVEVANLTRLTKLTHLELRFNSGNRPLRLMPMNKLTGLRELQSLKLYFPPKLPAWMDHFVWLESLTLSPRTSAMVNLTECKQLTYLCFGPCESSHIPVILPETSCLHTVAVHARCDFENLADAQDLKRLELSSYNSVLSSIFWPLEMASLSVIKLCEYDAYYCADIYYDTFSYFRSKGLGELPDVWQNYTNLMCLKLPFFYGRKLPDWFSQLQQLRGIHMPEAEFAYFPSAFSQLQQLQHLELDKVQGLFLPDPIVGLADLQQLTYLNFGFQADKYGCELNSLKDLSLALQTKDRPLHRKECLCNDGNPKHIWTFCIDA